MAGTDLAGLEPATADALGSRVGMSRAGDAARAAAEGVRVAICCAEFNGGVTARLLEGAIDTLEGLSVPPSSVVVSWVPGAFELPLAARWSATAPSFTPDAVVCLGAVIRGDTAHFDFVAGECASGLQRVALDTGVPVVFGVLTTETLDQALERSGAGSSNKGHEAALTALAMVDLGRRTFA